MAGSSDDSVEAKTANVADAPVDSSKTKSKGRRQQWKDAKEVKAKAKADGGPPATFKNFFRVLNFGNWFDMLLIGICSITALVAGVAMPLMFLILGRIVDNFTKYFIPGSGVTKAQFTHSVSMNALIIFGLFWAKFIMGYISFYCVRVSGLRISSALRLAYLKALFRQPMGVVDVVSPGTISSRITASANTIQLGISQQFAIFLEALALMLGSYIVSFTRSALLTVVASATLPFVIIVYASVIPFFIRYHRDIMRFNEQASALAFEVITSIRIVAAFCAEKKLSARHHEFLDKARATDLKVAPLMGMAFAPIMFSMYATYALTFWFGIKQFQGGHLSSVGSIITVLFSVMTAVMGISRLLGPMIQIGKVAAAATDILATIDAEVPDISGLRDPDVSAETDITFQGVSFAYPTRRKVQVLNQVDLVFEASKTTAIVGPSGSGKSTIVGLLERWYGLDDYQIPSELRPRSPKVPTAVDTDGNAKGENGAEVVVAEKNPLDPLQDAEDPPIGGRVMIGDVDLATVDVKWWRSQIGLVQQDPFLFNESIYVNVAHGLSGTRYEGLDEVEKRAMIEEACRQAYADEFITRLPMGYDTMVGESGIKLSGGQRQRIAIARSIVKQPSILILDEATSAIDVRTEKVVQKALDRVSEHRTTVVIAHRLSTIKKADKILVLRQGQVMEQGTHSQLLENAEGIYSGLVRAQNISMGAEHEFEDEKPDLEDERPQRDDDFGKDSKEHAIEEMITSDGFIVGYQQLGFLSTFGKILYEQRQFWKHYTVVIICCCAAGAVYPLQAWIFAKLIVAFTITDPAQLTKTGNFWSLMFFVLALSMFVVYFILTWTAHAVSANIQRIYRKEYLDNVLRKRIAFFDAEGNSPGSLTARLTADPGQIEMVLGGQMSMSYVSVFNLIGSLIISFYYGWKLSLVGLCVLLPAILSAGFVRIRLEKKFEKLNAEVFAESSQFATEAVGAFRTVQSLVLEDEIVARYERLMAAHVRVATIKSLTWTLWFSLSDSIDMACQAFILWYGGTLLASHEYNLQQYFVIYQAITQGGQAAGTWFSFAPNIANATAGANRILSSRFSSPSMEHEPKTEQPSEKNAGIEFEDVNFSYKSRNIPVLTGLNLSIKPGQFIALVGATGCGKSTVISLLERFYDVDAGRISYGTQDIKDLDVKPFRRNISLVAQESTLYEGTVRENVCLSVEEDQATDEALFTVCKSAQIHDFITSLPEGYATRLGPKGVSLSGGQRQRLALARALLRNPNILLLDEATSSLDSESEKLVQEAIESAAGAGDRTIIAVAHRLATIQKADVIFVLGSGSVLEFGTHQDLLKARGVYYSMCQAQALDR